MSARTVKRIESVVVLHYTVIDGNVYILMGLDARFGEWTPISGGVNSLNREGSGNKYFACALRESFEESGRLIDNFGVGYNTPTELVVGWRNIDRARTTYKKVVEILTKNVCKQTKNGRTCTIESPCRKCNSRDYLYNVFIHYIPFTHQFATIFDSIRTYKDTYDSSPKRPSEIIYQENVRLEWIPLDAIQQMYDYDGYNIWEFAKNKIFQIKKIIDALKNNAKITINP